MRGGGRAAGYVQMRSMQDAARLAHVKWQQRWSAASQYVCSSVPHCLTNLQEQLEDLHFR